MNLKKLTEYLDSLPQKGYVGVDCAVMLEHRNIYRHSAGFSDMEAGIPMTEDRTYFIYSASKVYAAAAAMILYEEGGFSLDDPISEYLPAFNEMLVLRKDGSVGNCETPITVRHLLTMTSGMGHDYKCSSIRKCCDMHPEGCTLAEVADAIAKEPILFEPGTSWTYSYSLDIIARMIEVISGKNYGEFLNEKIFSPLEMSETGFEMTPERLAKMAIPYQWDRETQQLIRQPKKNYLSFSSRYESASAGLISTVNDSLKFADALACGGISGNGIRILKPESVDLIRKNHLSGNALCKFQEYRGDSFGYGFGVETLIKEEAKILLDSVGEFGWHGAHGFWIAANPSEKLAICFGQHRGPSDSWIIEPTIRKFIYE